VPLAEAGIEIEGLDPAPEMLAICQQKLEGAGKIATLHQGTMESLDLGKKFHSIIIPGASFQLLIDPADAVLALNKIREHLEPGGQLLVSLYIPWFEIVNDVAQGQWRLHKQSVRESDGAKVLCHTCTDIDRHAQLLNVWNRYEIIDGAGKIAATELHEMQLRYYHQNEFLLLLGKCGFEQVVPYADFQDEEPADGTAVITYRAMK
jgi:SAM-dependent methyltransferase